MNEKATTITWLNNQDKKVAEQRLWDLMVHNIQSFANLISFVGKQRHELRMVRLGSGILLLTQNLHGVIFGNKKTLEIIVKHN